jgi:hypothetical protein
MTAAAFPSPRVSGEKVAGQRPDEGQRQPAPMSAAPGPYDWMQIVAPNSASLGHLYLTDTNGRKIGVVWGPHPEKAATCALLAAAWDLAEALRGMLTVHECLELPGDLSPQLREALDQRVSAARVALCRTEERPGS